MRPASCILLYHQLAVVMLQPARCTELFPVHIDGGILVVFLYPVPYVLFPAQANEFIQINVGYPACLVFCFLETIFVGRQLAELYGPFRQGDLPFLYIGSKDVLIIVLRKIVVQIEMFYAYQQMVLQPFFQENTLILEYGADGYGVFLLLFSGFLLHIEAEKGHRISDVSDKRPKQRSFICFYMSDVFHDGFLLIYSPFSGYI